MKINENRLAQQIARTEGGAQNLSIGQIKEVVKATLDELATYPASDVLALVEKHAAQ